MKRGWMLGILCLSMFLGGCGRNREDTYLLILSSGTSYNEKIAAGFTEVAEQLGKKVKVETPEEMSVTEQYRLLQSYQSKNISGLAIVPNSFSAYMDLIEEYAEASIPAVSVDATISTESIFLELLSFDADQTAMALLEYAASSLDGNGQLAILSSTNQSIIAEAMISEIRTLLEAGAYPGILLTEIAYGNDDEDRYLAKMEYLCEKYENLDLVLTLSSEATRAAAAYLTENGLEAEVQVAGYGIEEEVQEYLGGALAFYYTCDPEMLGALAAWALYMAQQENVAFSIGDLVTFGDFGSFEVFNYGGVYRVEGEESIYPVVYTNNEVYWVGVN